jgi:hypothetical protein
VKRLLKVTVRTPAGSAPAPSQQLMAALRNTDLNLARLRGATNIAASRRRNAWANSAAHDLGSLRGRGTRSRQRGRGSEYRRREPENSPPDPGPGDLGHRDALLRTLPSDNVPAVQRVADVCARRRNATESRWPAHLWRRRAQPDRARLLRVPHRGPDDHYSHGARPRLAASARRAGDARLRHPLPGRAARISLAVVRLRHLRDWPMRRVRGPSLR